MTVASFQRNAPALRDDVAHPQGGLEIELNSLSKQGRWAEMSGLIDDKMLSTLAVRDEPAAIAGHITRRFGAVADRVGFYLPYSIDPACIVEVRAGFD